MRKVFQDAGDKLLRFPRRRSVANRDQLDTVLVDQATKGFSRVVEIVVRRGRVNDSRFQHRSVFVEHRQLATGPKRRIEPEHALLFDWTRHEQVLQIDRERRDGFLIRRFLERASNLAFDGRHQQPFHRVLDAHL